MGLATPPSRGSAALSSPGGAEAPRPIRSAASTGAARCAPACCHPVPGLPRALPSARGRAGPLSPAHSPRVGRGCGLLRAGLAALQPSGGPPSPALPAHPLGRPPPPQANLEPPGHRGHGDPRNSKARSCPSRPAPPGGAVRAGREDAAGSCGWPRGWPLPAQPPSPAPLRGRLLRGRSPFSAAADSMRRTPLSGEFVTWKCCCSQCGRRCLWLAAAETEPQRTLGLWLRGWGRRRSLC